MRDILTAFLHAFGMFTVPLYCNISNGIEDDWGGTPLPKIRQTPELLSIGKVQLRVLAAIDRLGTEAYGAEIERWINTSPDSKPLALGQIYMTLKRLEDRGFIESKTVSARPVKGGRSRRVFSLTRNLGVPALQLIATPNAEGALVAQT